MIIGLNNMFINKFKNFANQRFLIWNNNSYLYNDLVKIIKSSDDFLVQNNVCSGDVVSIEADFSPYSIGMLFALIFKKTIIVPLASNVAEKSDEFRLIAKVEKRILIDKNDKLKFEKTSNNSDHEFINKLKIENKAGLILFSSGSTGKSKAMVHDFEKILQKFENPRPAKTTFGFLLFDHIGGINTMLHVVLNGGCLVTITNRTPTTICEYIQKYKVQILPATPSFLNLFLISEQYSNFDLSSLELVTYGTEVMSQEILKKFHEIFPKVILKQTYGLSEVGILSTKSEKSDSLWIKIGENDHKTRIKDGMLEVKSNSTMIGYLNAESPFTEDGWFKTGDAVEEKDGYIKILGRNSEIINVGGQKVYPIEIENELNKIDNIADCLVKGEKNALMGQIVVAIIKLINPENISDLTKRIRSILKKKLENYKIPHKIIISCDDELHNQRFKKIRK
jgi:acyl-coenzyme A synthetase/AMP-(fatty) acid ligase